MKLYADGLCSDLQFCPDTSDKFEAAINDLAWFLGISSQRPEKDYKDGPDNLWALPNGTFLVIECKNGVTSDDGISKKDAGQLSQSMEWFCVAPCKGAVACAALRLREADRLRSVDDVGTPRALSSRSQSRIAAPVWRSLRARWPAPGRRSAFPPPPILAGRQSRMSQGDCGFQPKRRQENV